MINKLVAFLGWGSIFALIWLLILDVIKLDLGSGGALVFFFFLVGFTAAEARTQVTHEKRTRQNQS